MPWKGVTVVEQRENFLRDYNSRYYTVSDLAERFSISRKAAYTWIERYEERGREGLADQSCRPHSCQWQAEQQICDALVELRQAHSPSSLVASGLVTRARHVMRHCV